MTCACGNPVNDAFICNACTRQLTANLSSVPWLESQLAIAIAKQTRYVDHVGVRAPFAEPLPYAPEASEVAFVLRNTLDSWCRVIAGPPLTGHRRQSGGLETLSGMSGRLRGRLGLIRAHSAANECHDEIRAAVDLAERTIDRPTERWYAGPCDHCHHDMYAKPDTGHITCTCGTTYNIGERRTWLITESVNVLATAAEISRALTTLATPVTADRIYQWRTRKRLLDHGKDAYGKPLYRVGDILDLLDNVNQRQRRAPHLR